MATGDTAAAARARADREIEVALNAAHQGHDGFGVSDRVGYAGIAQAHALVAVAHELRALGETLAVIAAAQRKGAAHI